eukprot:40224-Alexandrium_andersonii.AAC.1
MSSGEGSARAPASELRSSTSSGIREPPWVINSSVGLQPGEWRRLRLWDGELRAPMPHSSRR